MLYLGITTIKEVKNVATGTMKPQFFSVPGESLILDSLAKITLPIHSSF